MLVSRFVSYPTQRDTFIEDLKQNHRDLNLSLVMFSISGVYEYQRKALNDYRLEDLVIGE